MAVLVISEDKAYACGSDSSRFETTGSYDAIGYSGGTRFRRAFRFPLTTFPGGTITQVVFSAASPISGVTRTGVVCAYNGDGQADPEADSGSTQYPRCAATLITSFVLGPITTHNVDITSAAASVAAAKSAVNRFSIGVRASPDTSGTNWLGPSTLTITYTPFAAVPLFFDLF